MTSLESQMKTLSEKANQIYDSIAQSEEATKTALILPFLIMLGYDVFNPLEVIPEFTTDVGTKKGEKVDYALLPHGKVTVLIEAKKASSKLDCKRNLNQLFRYFSTSEAKIGILTNGTEYLFFSDLEKTNQMDLIPFFRFSIHNPSSRSIQILKNLQKENWDSSSILSQAEELKTSYHLKNLLQEEIQKPSEELIKFFFKKTNPGKRWTTSIQEPFSRIFSKILNQVMAETFESKITSILHPEDEPEIVTTPEELEAFRIIQGILIPLTSPETISFRDSKKYFYILLNDHNRKPICKLHLTEIKKELYLPGHEVITLEGVQDLWNFKTKIMNSCKTYLPSPLDEDDIEDLIQELLNSHEKETH